MSRSVFPQGLFHGEIAKLCGSNHNIAISTSQIKGLYPSWIRGANITIVTDKNIANTT